MVFIKVGVCCPPFDAQAHESILIFLDICNKEHRMLQPSDSPICFGAMLLLLLLFFFFFHIFRCNHHSGKLPFAKGAMQRFARGTFVKRLNGPWQTSPQRASAIFKKKTLATSTRAYKTQIVCMFAILQR